MGKDTRINVTLDFNADLKNIQGAIGNIQKSLQGLSLPQGLNKNFLSLFSNLEAEVKNFGSLTSKELTTAGDFSAVEKSGKKILDLYRKLGVEIDSLSDTDKMKLFPSNTVTTINKINNAMKQFNSATDRNKKAIDTANKGVAKYTAELNSLKEEQEAVRQKKVVDPTEFSKAQKDIKKYREEVQALQTELDSRKADTKARMEKDGRTSPDKRTKQYKAELAVQQQLEQALKNLADARTAANEITTETRQINELKKLKQAYDEAEINLNSYREELKKLGDGGEAEAFKKMMESLKDVEGIDPSSIKSFKDLEEALQDIKTKAGDDIDEKIEEIVAAMRAAQGPADQFADDMREAGDGIKEMSREAQDLENLKHRILDFFSISNAIQLFKRAVKSAFDTVKELDATMTEAAVVTDFSVGDMWDKLPSYSAEASKLGATINDLYGATTLYYQQGLKTNEAVALGTETMKMARVAGMESTAATEAMTAALRGFNMELNETSATRVNDVYSELAAITAADTEQIATAMSKTASIASAANMEFESTAAFLSQIIETTQEAPETAGTALKTIIARFSEVKSLREKGLSTGEDEEGEIIDVNKIQAALRTVGISMDEFFAGTEGLDSVLIKLASKWETLDFETQRYIATTAAGSRQQSRFIAMMSDYDRTMELVGAANNSAGASQEQFNKTLESLDSKLNNLKNAWDEFVMGLANNEVIKAGVDVLTFLLETINKIISSLSGGSGIVKTFVTAIGAIGAFKLGQKSLNKIAPEFASKMFGDGKKLGQGWALKLGAGIKDGIKKIKNGEMGEILLNKIGINKQLKGKDLTKEFGLDELSKLDFSKVTPQGLDDLKDNILKQVGNLSEDLQDQIDLDALSDATDISGIQNALGPAGDSIKIIGQDAANAGVQMQKMQASMQTVGTVAGAAGGALMMFAGLLEEAGASDELVTMVKGLGIAFMALSAVMPIVSMGFTAAGAAGVSSGVATQLAWWWVMLIVAAVALLVAGLVAAGQAAKKASLAGQLEAAQKAAEAAAEAANKAKEAYDDLLSGKSEYDELQNTLENLTKGTDEWKKALIEANSQVLELLTTYPELAKYVSRGEDGQLIISEVGWNEVLNQQLADTQRAQGAAMAAKMQETRISGQIAEKDFLTKFKNDTMTMAYDAALMATGGVAHNAMALTPGAGGAAAYLAEDYIAQGFENQGYGVYDGAGSDSNFVYDVGLIEELRNLNIDADSGGLTEANEAVKELMDTYGKTEEEIRELITALNEYDAAVIANQELLQGQAEQALMAGADEEILASDYNDAVVEAYANQMTTDDYQASIDASAKAYSVKNDAKRKELMEQRGLEVSGDRTKDLEVLYADLHGLQSIEDIPDDIKGNNDALAEAIATAMANEEQTGKMEKFQERLNKVKDDKTKREIASLLSGNASMLSMKQITELSTTGKNLGDYYKELGYESKEQLITDQGYVDKAYSQLNREDQEALAAKEGGITKDQFTDENGNFDAQAYEEALNQWINSQTGVVTAEVQFELDQEQMIQEMTEKTTKAAEAIKGKTGIDLSQTELSGQTIQNLAKQTASMGAETATEYVKNFQAVIESSDLTGAELSQLENYLSTVDWSNLDEATDALERMRAAGVDTSVIENYWDVAVSGAQAFIRSMQEALNLMDKFHNKVNTAIDIEKALIEGNATTDQVIKLVESGVDISKFQRTAEGWGATEEVAKESTDIYKKTAANDAKEVADAHWDSYNQAWSDYNKMEKGDFGNLVYGAGTVSSYLSKEDGVIKAGNIETYDAAHTISAFFNDGEFIEPEEDQTEEQYIASIQQKLDDWIFLLNKGDQTGKMFDKEVEYTAAAAISADENALQGGTDQSIRYSMQNQASEAGLDSSEVTDNSEALKNIKTLENASQGLRDRLALDIALAAQGAQEITDNYDDWAKAINDGPGNPKYAASMKAMTASTSKLLGVSEEVAESILKEKKNRDLVARAAKGEEEAIKKVHKLATKEVVLGFEVDSDTTQDEIDAITSYINDTEFPTLEVGTSIDTDPAYKGFRELIEGSGLTAQQMSAALESMNFEPEIEWVPVTQASLSEDEQTYTYTDDLGQTHTVKASSAVTQNGELSIPIINGNATVYKAPDPSVGNKKSGGGGGSKKPKKQHWENPYDELYNTQQKVDETLRERNQLEREYDRLLQNRDVSAAKLLENQVKQLKNLRQEYDLQKKIANQELKDAKNAKNYEYLATRKNGDEEEQVWSTFQKEADYYGIGDLNKYAKYNDKTGEIEINWDKIEALEDNTEHGEDIGTLIEAYISHLEEQSDKAEEANDRLEEIEDEVAEIKRQAMSDYLDFEQKVYDALVQQAQQEIDDMQSLSDTLSEANSSILDSLQESIDLERQIRDNTKQEEDIADMEARLAYLRRDTSGANQQEILQLEEQLGDARESYSDSLIDQQLQKLSDDNAKAEEQRQNQIDLAQAQLDYWTEIGYFWPQVNKLITDAAKAEDFSETDLADVLKDTEGFKGMSYFGKKNWMYELAKEFALAGQGKSNWKVEEAEQAGKLKKGQVVNEKGKSVGALTYDKENKVWKDSNGGTYKTLTWDEAQGKYVASDYTPKKPQSPPIGETPIEPTESYPYGKPSEATKTVKIGQRGKPVQAVQYALNKLDYGNSGTKNVDGVFGEKTKTAVQAFQRAMKISADGKVGPDTRAKFKAKQFKTGGLADFTGPAWLDGTKSKPEIILNQQDSKNFIMLKDVLGEILQGATSAKPEQKSGGDNYFDISIIVDEISSDYDVDKMAARIKQQIYDDSTYRNVNAINLIR